MIRTAGKPASVLAALLTSAALGLFASGSAADGRPDARPASLVAFENVRVVTATELGTIESATLLISGDTILQVGTDVGVPPGAERINAQGMTIVPAFIDTHAHTNQARDSLIRDLRRLAVFGVGTVASLGVDTSDAAFEVRDQPADGAARILTAGRGITAPEVGRETAPIWITTPEEGRTAVRENVARGVDLIKIWVDDRNDRFPKLDSPLYSAVIAEAHASDRQVTAHVFELGDAKGLLRAGVDAFAHGIRDRDIDDEFMELLAQHPVVLNPNLPARGVPTNYQWLAPLVSEAEIEKLEQASEKDADARAFFDLQARNLLRMHAQGTPIVLGTDTSFDFPGGDKPWSVHDEMADMVAAGMSPQDVVLSATRNAAAFLQLSDRGTLAPGMSADFVVLRSNPLDDITNTRTIDAVYLRGKSVGRSELP
ncbi:MAG: amidohydrolase family protein [Woeseia sp.]